MVFAQKQALTDKITVQNEKLNFCIKSAGPSEFGNTANFTHALAVTCRLPRFWQNDRGLLRATAVTRGWNGYRNKSAQKVDPGEENSPAAPAGIRRTRDLSITSPTL